MGDNNKENQRPLPVPVRKVVVPGQYGQPNSAESFSVGRIMGKEEKIYSEEDREVCTLTGCQGNRVARASPQSASLVNGHESAGSNSSSDVHSHYRCLNIPILGPDWKVFSDCCSQTSPYGPLDESPDDNVHPYLGDNAQSTASVHHHFHAEKIAMKKFKPYARKISPNLPMRDAQVQVMCPLGLNLGSPNSPPFSSAMTQSVTSANTFIDMNQSISQSIVTQSDLTQSTYLLKNVENGGNVPKEKYDSTVQSRVSYISQGSKEGDSGSDASTVKSERYGSETELGRSTPDSIGKNFKSIKRSVIPKVTSKLAAENIDLSAEPYSSQVCLSSIVSFN